MRAVGNEQYIVNNEYQWPGAVRKNSALREATERLDNRKFRQHFIDMVCGLQPPHVLGYE